MHYFGWRSFQVDMFITKNSKELSFRDLLPNENFYFHPTASFHFYLTFQPTTPFLK